MKNTTYKTNKASVMRILALLLTAIMLLAAFSGCKGKNDEEGGVKEHTVTVTSDTGALIEGVTVLVYSNDTLSDLIAVERTDANGVMHYSAEQKDGYVATLSDVPDGYGTLEKYIVTGTESTIVLTTVLPTDKNKVYKNGDLMYSFTLTDINGNEHRLTELMKQKKAIVLNFWYINCNPCAAEFPYLNEAYGKYSDKIELLAINPTDDSVANIQSYVTEKGLSFPVVSESPEWQTMMGISGYPTTVVIDRHGRICLVHTGSVPNTEEFEKIFAYFTADDYKQRVLNGISDIEDESGYTNEGGNPTEVGGVTEFEMTLEPGKTEYCDVYKITDMILTVNSANALIIYNGEEYRPENGVISLYVVAEDTFTPIHLGVGNEGNAKETFKIKFSYPEGSSGNPYTLNLGEFTTEISEGNDQGVYYKYVAQKSGTLTLECIGVSEGVEYDYILYNLDSYAQRTVSEDGNGTSSVSIAVKKGQTVTLTIGTLPDSSNVYPAASFTSKASFEESDEPDISEGGDTVEYVITIKNGDGKAVKGVHVKFVADSETVELTTDDNGCATTTLTDLSCTAILTVPDGYTAEKTEFALTSEAPAGTASIIKKTVVTADYTVTVKDKDGKAVKNVLVTVGNVFAYTDAAGKAVLDLPVDSYTASISLPTGYTADKTTYSFPAGSKSLTITVTKGSGQSSQTGVKYSVTVKKADGTAVSDVAVVFEKNGVSAAVQTTNSSGVATATLEKASYTARLAFIGGSTLNYDKSSAVLTASKTSVTVIVAEPVSDETTELYLGMAHHLSIGGNYAKLSQSEDITYFVFVPERDGVYSFTTSYDGTVISYWGANTSFIYDQTAATDYSANTFSLNIKAGNLGAVYIIGVKGDEDCVVIVKRTGNAQLGVDDLPWTIYKPQKAPTAFSLGAGAGFTASFFDLSGKTGDYTLVYNDADGYYHLGSKNGSIVYVMLGENAPYISFKNLVDKTGLKKYFYDANGAFVKKEDYTDCMTDYVMKMDEETGLYPLTDDLIYMIQQGGDAMGWWDKSSATYIFSDVSNLNTEIAWMFALCTVTIK